MVTTNDAVDKQIIKQVLYGDTNSFKLLIDQYRRHIFSIGMRFFNNVEDACDFVQEVFIKAYTNLASYTGLFVSAHLDEAKEIANYLQKKESN